MQKELEQVNDTETKILVKIESSKSKLAAALLCFFLGGLGIHRFYLGRVGTGVAMLLLTIFGWFLSGLFIGIPLMGIVLIWEIVDFIRILVGNLTDATGGNLK